MGSEEKTQTHLELCSTRQVDTIGVSRGMVWCFRGEIDRMVMVLWTEAYQKSGEEGMG